MTDSTIDEIHYCAVHPDQPTELRCNKCDRFMCAKCAVSTPVGYRCRECVRQIENKFFTAGNTDYVVIAAVSAGLSFIGGVVMSMVGFVIVAIFAGLVGGGMIAEAALRSVSKRRGRYSGEVGVAGIAIGSLLGAIAYGFFRYNDIYGPTMELYNRLGRPLPQEIPAALDFVIRNAFSISVLIFVVLAAFAVYARLKT